MKRILIFSQAMEIGGAEQALLGLLEVIDPQKYQVDLFLMRHSGEWLSAVPQNVTLLPEIREYSCLAIPIRNALKKGGLGIVFSRAYGKWRAKRYVNRHHLKQNDVAIDYSHRFTKWLMPEIQPEVVYDLAISFLSPHYFVAGKVKAKKKIAWIHTDYIALQTDIQSQLSMWSPYDRIVSISDAVTENFVKVFPSLKDKVITIENIQPMKTINRLTSAFSVNQEMPSNSIRLLSIGRFSRPKNFDNVPNICKTIRESGLNVKWYLIGYGTDELLIRQKIAEEGMESHVIILGKKENPYPYIKACDLYVQPSRYEGKCVAVREAQMLGKPVVITNYATSSSQLEDGEDGVIVPMDNEGCAKGIVALLRDTELMKELSRNCLTRNYSNSEEIEKIYMLMQ